MDTEFAGESSFQGEKKIGTKNIAVLSDFVEEDSDAKITLAVTSDEDSKDSGKNQGIKEEINLAINKNIIMEKITEHDEISPISRSSTSSKRKSRSGSGVRGRKISSESDVVNNPVKRKFSQMYCSSDEEEEFYGFEEESGLPICGNGYKKIKTNPEEDPNNDEINKNIKLEKVSIKDELDIAEIKLPLEERSMSPKESPKQEVDVDKPHNTPVSKAKTKDLNYRKPFDMGWKREFVLRAMPGLSKEKGEVYYISPSGKKLRTRTEVLQHLAPGLTLDNFTFSKEPLGFEEEVIRSAKPSVRTATSTPVEVNREPLGKRIPKPKAPKGASPPPQGWTAAKAVKSASVAQSPRPVVQTRPDDSESKTTSKSKAAGGKSTKKNSTIDSTSTPSLQTGDDLPIRKRVQNSRNKFSTESSHQSSHQQNNQQVQQVRSASLSSSSESFAANFFSNVSLGYDILFHIFQYLKVQELLRAACVCRVWYIVGNHRSLWKTVRMKNSQVNDWTGLAAALRRNETKHLDLRKMLISSTNAEEMWASFSKNIQTVVSLETIDLCRCSSKIVESLFNTNPSLKVLNAVTIKDDTLTLENLNRLENLQELRLKSIDGCNLDGNLMALESLKNLRHLSLTSFRLLGLKEIEIIGELVNLESLELGECSELGVKFSTDVLPKLVNLERLRLEKGQGECCTIEILEAVSKLEKLVQLELVNFDIKTGFDEKLGQCKNIKRLLLIPTYISQSATTNNIVLTAVLQLTETLQTLTWAVTLELLRVTALYVDQCDNKKKDKKFFDESIPVLKPVPGIPDDNEKSQKTASDVPQVEILPLVKVEKILTAGMPTTKFKILKVPYHATWRQNLVDMH